jgi:hypothetical protein
MNTNKEHEDEKDKLVLSAVERSQFFCHRGHRGHRENIEIIVDVLAYVTQRLCALCVLCG